MRIDSATPPLGFAQNDSIAGGVEISNGNERRVQTFICGANSTHLALPVFVPLEERMKRGFRAYPIILSTGLLNLPM
jgi:hypothetical protein